MARSRAYALVLALIAALAVGCATRLSVEDPFLTVVWGDAYTIEGETQVNEDGETVCVSEDCVEVRGAHIGDTLAGIFKALFDVVGALLPRGVSP